MIYDDIRQKTLALREKAVQGHRGGAWEEEKHPRGPGGKFAQVAEHDEQAFPHLAGRRKGIEDTPTFQSTRAKARALLGPTSHEEALRSYRAYLAMLPGLRARRQSKERRAEYEGWAQAHADRLATHGINHMGEALTPASPGAPERSVHPREALKPAERSAHPLAALSALERAASDEEISAAVSKAFEYRAQELSNRGTDHPEVSGAFAHLSPDERADMQRQAAEGFAWEQRASIEERSARDPLLGENLDTRGYADRPNRVAVVREGQSPEETAYITVHELMHLAEPKDLAVEMYWGSPKARGESESRVDFAAMLVGDYFGIRGAEYSRGYQRAWAPRNADGSLPPDNGDRNWVIRQATAFIRLAQEGM